MRGKRKATASLLLNSREPLRRRTLTDLLNEFEMLGFLVCTNEALPLREAWEFFSQWALGYWYAAEPDIAAQRERDPTFYSQYDQLVRKLADYEGQQLTPTKTAEDIAAFYKDPDVWREIMIFEAALDSEQVSKDPQNANKGNGPTGDGLPPAGEARKPPPKL